MSHRDCGPLVSRPKPRHTTIVRQLLRNGDHHRATDIRNRGHPCDLMTLNVGFRKSANWFHQKVMPTIKCYPSLFLSLLSPLLTLLPFFRSFHLRTSSRPPVRSRQPAIPGVITKWVVEDSLGCFSFDLSMIPQTLCDDIQDAFPSWGRIRLRR